MDYKNQLKWNFEYLCQIMKIFSDEELARLLDRKEFRLLSQTADSLGLECYVVGGYVRDLFLERPSKDIDVVVVASSL